MGGKTVTEQATVPRTDWRDTGKDSRRGCNANGDGGALASAGPRVVDGGVTVTGVLSRQRGNLITIVNTR